MRDVVVVQPGPQAALERRRRAAEPQEQLLPGFRHSDVLHPRLPGSRVRVTSPARSSPSRWWVRVGCRMPMAAASWPWVSISSDFSAWRTSQVGAEPPTAASASSNALFSALAVSADEEADREVGGHGRQS